MAELDPRCYWVGVQRDPSPERAECYKVAYQDENESGGRHSIFVILTDANNLPMIGKKVWHDWPDGKIPLYTNGQGVAEVEIWPNNFDPKNGPGPYRVYVDGPSDIAFGMGLPLSRHVNYLCYFRMVSGEPPPPPSGALTEQRVREITREEIGKAKVIAG